MLIYFRERGREGERERDGERESERSIHWLPLLCFLTWDRTHHLGMCPDLESIRDLSVYQQCSNQQR